MCERHPYTAAARDNARPMLCHVAVPYTLSKTIAPASLRR